MALDKILIVDDEILVRDFLAETLKRKKLEVTTAESGEKGLEKLKTQTFDLIITDMKMPGMTGLEFLKKVKEKTPETLVMVVTAFGSIENAVEAMNLGAFNYLIKPFSPDTIEAVIEKARELISLKNENQFLREEMQTQNVRTAHRVIGESQVMQEILAQVKKIAKSNASVFINGESGTGKEVIAHAIHENSLRAKKPFVKVNCAAVPENLLESEFFGHEKGSFTGALNKRVGRFELAHGGTLMLDEVTEIPMPLQPKLLRAVQEKEIERVGGTKVIAVDVRFVATSNRNMKEAIEDKIFREDLYYRLNVIPIRLPPLRERRDDILPLSRYFLEKMCLENHKKPKTLSPDAEKKLLSYDWPGNIRELANIIERAVVLDDASTVEGCHLYLEGMKPTATTATTLEEIEKQHIEKILKEENDRTQAAKLLGISVKILKQKVEAYGLEDQQA